MAKWKKLYQELYLKNMNANSNLSTFQKSTHANILTSFTSFLTKNCISVLLNRIVLLLAFVVITSRLQ